MKYEKYITENDNGTYSIPFSTKNYVSMRSANAAVAFYLSPSGMSGDTGIARAKIASFKKNASLISNVISSNISDFLNMRITYDDIYKGSGSNGFIGWNETIDYDGDTAGGGFYRAFDGIWDDLNVGSRSKVYRTIGFLFYYRNDKGIKSLIEEIGQNKPDSIYDVLVNSLNNIDEDTLNSILEEYKKDNEDEFREVDTIESHLSSDNDE